MYRHITIYKTFLFCLFCVPVFTKSSAQCPHTIDIRKVVPSGDICTPRFITLEARYGAPGYSIKGEFRWYSSASATDAHQVWPVHEDGIVTSNYELYATNGATVWVSFYHQDYDCETNRVFYTAQVTPSAPTMSVDYARECGDGILKVQLLANASGVIFQLFKLLSPNNYHLIASNSTGYFEVSGFQPEDSNQYFARFQPTSECFTADYYTLNIDIQSNSPPIIIGTKSVCEGEGSVLTASGDGVGTFNWYDSNNNLLIQSSQYQVPSTLPVGTHIFRTEKRSYGGCVSQQEFTSFIVKPRPIDGSIQANKSTICLGESVTISSTGGIGCPYYWCSTNGGNSWNVFQQAFGGQSSFSFTPTQTGTYRFHLRNRTDCGFCWDSGNSGCPTYPYVDVNVIKTVGGTTSSAATNQVVNTVYSKTFGATKLNNDHVGTIVRWEYSLISSNGPYTPWGQAGQSVTSQTCCIDSPNRTIWIRAVIKNGVCQEVPSAATSYYWQSTPPVANAGPDIEILDDQPSTTLTGTVTGGNGSITSYVWAKISGGELVLTNSTSSTVTVSGYKPGDYTLRFTVTDQYGYQSDDLVTARVKIANNINYIMESTPLISGVTVNTINSAPDASKTVTYTYFDGIGRPIQQTEKQGAPSENDMVRPIVYDALGRQPRSYLPIVVNQKSGYFKNLLFSENGDYVDDFYDAENDKIANTQYPFSRTIFEPTPLDRVLKQGAAGEAWKPNEQPLSIDDNSVKKRYEFNREKEVLLFTYDITTGSLGLSNNANQRHYVQNQLYANKTYDEHNNEVIEYVDKEGRTVCKKVQYATEGTGSDIKKLYTETYYLYDDFGNLVVVLPPEATKELKKLYNMN